MVPGSSSSSSNHNGYSNSDDVIGDYRPGSIRRVKLQNFLTHGNVEFKPGPRLNMVVGANGTGKSTILNAICLGLGGEPKLLGRADDLRAFIMHGKDTAMIEIELAPQKNVNGEQEQHIIQRQIERNKGSEKGRGRGASTFFINGTKANVQAVRDIVCHTYNIQIDNLCTFLPQDKVGNFSGFTDQERLLETEKTLPTNQFFYKRHLELIETEETINSDISNVDSIKDLLKRKTHEFDRLEISKAREEERKKAEEQLELLRKKKLWLAFDAARDKCVELKEEKEKIRDELKVHSAAIAPLEENHRRIEAMHKELQTKSRELDGQCQAAQREMEKQISKVEKHDDDMEMSMSQYLQISSKRERLELQYNEAKDKLKSLEANLATMQPVEQVEQQYNKAKEMIQSIKREYDNAKREDRKQRELFQELEDTAGRVQQKLAKMNDDGARRRENVFRNVSHLQDICGWIEKNRNQFRRPVWGPIALEVTTKSQFAASYLEFHTPNNILKSFVVETREDYDMLYSNIREKMGIPINVISVEGDTINTTRMYSEQKMQLLKSRYGIEGYLDETFKAPDPVMIALQKYASVHKVLVGGEKAQQAMDREKLRDVLSAPDTALGQQRMQNSCIFTVSDRIPYRYTQSVSQYSGKVGTRVDQVGPARLLAPGVPEEQKKQVEKELSEIHDEIAQRRPQVLEAENNVRESEVQLQNCQLKVQSFKQSLTSFQSFQSKIIRQRQRVHDAEKELQSNNEAKEKNDLAKSIMNRLVHSIAAIKVHGEQHKLLLQYTAENSGIIVNLTNVRTADRLAQEEIREKRYVFAELEQRVTLLSRQFNDEKAKLKKMKADAEADALLYDENGNDTPLKLQLDAIDVSTIIEVDAAIEDAERIVTQYSPNPEVLQQHQKLKLEIEDIQAQLAECTSARERSLNILSESRRDWEGRLETYIDKVNCLFTVYMSEMGCTGEVRLTKGPPQDNAATPKDNFRQWGLEIRVSFREGCKAEVLSAQRHSGGERSVSTILYLMALQDMMVAPFRCVDEINQGLDERNERLVFRRIVANSCRPPKNTSIDHSGQYFLITPKLLPNLTAMEEEAMTVLFVFNGPFNFKSPTEWGLLLDAPAAIEVVNDDENSDNITPIPRRMSKKSRTS